MVCNAKNYKNNVIDLKNIPFEYFIKNERQKNTFNSKNQNILLEDKFSQVKTIIDSATEEYIYNQLKFPTDVQLELSCSWMVLGYPGSRTNNHIHTNSIFSGIFYIHSEENTGDIIFSTHHTHMGHTSPTVRPNPVEFNVLNSLNWTIKPKTNDIIIFPSHLYHEVTTNTSDSIRCAIAFNYFLKGNISDRPSESLYM